MTQKESFASFSGVHSTRGPTLGVWRRFVCEWLAIGFVGVAVVFACVFTSLTKNLDRLVYDHLVTLRAEPLASEIALVSIDDASISDIGRWPWPRSTQARLIDAVAKAGAAAIVYDVLLTEPSDEDAVLAQALREAPTFLPLFVDSRTQSQAVGPVPVLARAAAGIGHIDVEADPDGIVRGVRLRERAGDASWPYLVVPLVADIWSGKIAVADGRYRGPPGQSIAQAVASTDAAFERNHSRILIPFSGEVPGGGRYRPDGCSTDTSRRKRYAARSYSSA